MSEAKGLGYWVASLSRINLPVLKQTTRDLNALHDDEEKLTAASVAGIIARDPIMTVKLLRYLQLHKHRYQTTEVVQIEQALLMLGIDALYNHVPLDFTVEEAMGSNIDALAHVLRVVHRLHRASEYARDWAVMLRDLHYEEVRIAALLHDIAEVLMWCFAPGQMLEIYDIQHKDKTLRSRDVQQQVLGFALMDLQRELVVQWSLPQLLFTLMNDSNANQPRVRNVNLAVRLARHSADDWEDAALPDDYKDIGELLRMPADEVMMMLKVEEGILCDLNQPH
ncbi:MAG: HDOD domain-containing protein [Gallionellaceae bacterium]|nr:HDOD domain-containing protein [Gallionellaceae bacterium]